MMTKTEMVEHLYIHVPFCKTICSYCDFVHRPYNQELVDKWLVKLSKDLSSLKEQSFKTIYIGGGTPSCLNYQQLKTLLSLIEPFSKDTIEYSIELNPESIDEEKVNIIKGFNLNRISIGLQSSNAALLKLMNRHHRFEDVENCIKLFKEKGIDNISIDIIYSLPTQTLDDLKQTLDDVLKLDVKHISLYSLTIEEGTIFAKKNYKPLDEDIEADMYELIEKTLTDNNYLHYEIANFALKGYESKHNLGYWNYDDYYGLSCGAVGKYNHQRHNQTCDIEKYLNNEASKEVEDIPLKEEAFENIMMSLRTSYGLDIDLFNKRYGLDFLNEYKEAIDKNKDYLEFKNNHCICNKREILNTILLDFIE